MIFCTDPKRAWIKPMRSKRFLLNPGVLSFGDYLRLNLIHSDSGDREQTSFGTTDIVFDNSEYVFLWAPGK